MAATTTSSSPTAEFHKQLCHFHGIVPSVTLLFFVLFAAAVAASEPHRSLIQRSSNNPQRKWRLESDSDCRWRRQDFRLESVVGGVTSGFKSISISSDPLLKQRFESDSVSRRRRRDLGFESDALRVGSGANHVSNNSSQIQKSALNSQLQKQISESEPDGQRRPRKRRLESESDGRKRRDNRGLESATLDVTSGTNHVMNNPSSGSKFSSRRRKDDRNSNSPPRKQRSDSKPGAGGRRRRDDSRFESAAHEVPSGPNPISN